MKNKSKPKNMKFLLLIVTTLVLPLTANQVLAKNGKTLPGHACKEVSGNASHVEYTWQGSIKNKSNIIVSVVCPVVRDENKTIANAVVHVRSSNASPLKCYFDYRNSANTSGASKIKESGKNLTNAYVHFGAINTMPHSSYSRNGLYSINCQLKPGDMVQSYFVLEHE